MTAPTEPRRAPELAAAMAETRMHRDLLAEVLRNFEDPQHSGWWHARVRESVLKKWQQHAGAPAPDPLAYRALLAERDLLRERLTMLVNDTPFEFRPDWSPEYEARATLRQRPGDEPLPVPNDRPSSHDLVIEDIALSEAPYKQRMAAAQLIVERKELGLKRCGSVLQSGKGRDSRRDLLEEIADACAYAKTWLGEPGGQDADDLDSVYRQLLLLLCLTAGGLP